MENTDNQEDIIEDIVESDLLSLEQGEVEESVSEDVEEIAEAGKKPASEDSELKMAKADEGEEDEDEDEEVAPKPKKAKAAKGEEEDEEDEEDEETVAEDASAQPDPVVANKAAEGAAAERFLKDRRKKKKGETSQDPETGKGKGLDTKETEKIAKASDAKAAEGSGVQEDAITSEDLTRLVEDEEGLTPEFKAKAALIFEAEVRTKVDEVTEQLQSEHEAKLNEEVEAINETLTNQIDAYLTYAVEEWIGDNKVAVESSLRTSIAENFMKSLKTLFEENYVEVPDSKLDLYGQLEDETSQLKEDLAKFKDIADTLADRVDDLNREKILSEATADLAETQAAKLLKLAEGVDFDGEFTKNVETLKKFYFSGNGRTLTEEAQETEEETVETIVEGADAEDEISKAPVDKTMASYMETLGRLKKSST